MQKGVLSPSRQITTVRRSASLNMPVQIKAPFMPVTGLSHYGCDSAIIPLQLLDGKLRSSTSHMVNGPWNFAELPLTASKNLSQFPPPPVRRRSAQANRKPQPRHLNHVPGQILLLLFHSHGGPRSGCHGRSRPSPQRRADLHLRLGHHPPSVPAYRHLIGGPAASGTGNLAN